MPDLGLLGMLGWHLVATALPGAAACLFCAHRGLGSVPVLLAIGLAASGATAIASFWMYYADPTAASAFVSVVLGASAAAVGALLWRTTIDRGVLGALLVALALWASASAFILFLGFLHGGTDNAIGTSAQRFLQLPSDNDIPKYFAGWFFEHGHEGTAPPYGEWQSSDRPPLQVGYVLSQRAFAWDDDGLHYQVLGVVLQQLWVVGLWALLLAAGVSRRTRALGMIAVLLSTLVIVNGFFVWPKLLPAAMLLAVAALALTPLWTRARLDPRAGALVGALVAVAMLGHGSSVFAVLALAAAVVARGFPGRRWVVACVAVGAVLYVPWMAYQKYDDPPGNRLAKWFLAGAVQIDDRGTVEAVVDEYSALGFGGALEHKGSNVVGLLGTDQVDQVRAAVDAALDGELAAGVRLLRQVAFFVLLPSLGLLALAPLIAAVGAIRRRGPPAELRFAALALATAGLGCLLWAVILFGGPQSGPAVHVGSYLLPVLALCGVVAALVGTFPRLAVGIVAVNAALTLALYVPSLDPPSGSGYSAFAAVIAAAALAGYVAVAAVHRPTFSS